MNQVLTKPILLTDPLEIIIKGCRENDLQCQDQLYRQCYPEMIKVCYRYAGDMDGAGIIFNNAMLRVFKHIHSYQDKGKLLAWIKTIVVNCAIDFIKQQNKFREQSTGDISDYEVNIPADVLSNVSAKEIRKIIQELPKATATVFNLYIYEGFTHKQVAESLGISEGTSKWHINEGRKLLKTKLENFINPGIKTNAAG
jgi:RNA polymerase sigma-70 factor (ECF subfamily)